MRHNPALSHRSKPIRGARHARVPCVVFSSGSFPSDGTVFNHGGRMSVELHILPLLLPRICHLWVFQLLPIPPSAVLGGRPKSHGSDTTLPVSPLLDN